jgi:hypothetical protein
MTKFLVILILGAAILAWCPWLKMDEALSIVNTKVAQLQEQNTNLCSISVDQTSIQKVPFGYAEKVLYDCTANGPEDAVLKSTDTVFVTFFKGTFGPPIRTFQ